MHTQHLACFNIVESYQCIAVMVQWWRGRQRQIFACSTLATGCTIKDTITFNKCCQATHLTNTANVHRNFFYRNLSAKQCVVYHSRQNHSYWATQNTDACWYKSSACVSLQVGITSRLMKSVSKNSTRCSNWSPNNSDKKLSSLMLTTCWNIQV